MQFLFSFLLFILAGHPVPAPTSTDMITTDSTAARAALTEFIRAADVRDLDRLERVLNPEFRVFVNQFMGKPGVTVIDRTTYLGMIRAEKLGGTPRTLGIKSVEVVGNNAYVRATLASKALHFESHYLLVEDQAGDWTVLSDIPYVTPVK